MAACVLRPAIYACVHVFAAGGYRYNFSSRTVGSYRHNLLYIIVNNCGELRMVAFMYTFSNNGIHLALYTTRSTDAYGYCLHWRPIA